MYIDSTEYRFESLKDKEEVHTAIFDKIMQTKDIISRIVNKPGDEMFTLACPVHGVFYMLDEYLSDIFLLQGITLKELNNLQEKLKLRAQEISNTG